ncbi:MAG: hypothetical protein RR318_06610, partial [Alistipes sp.]
FRRGGVIIASCFADSERLFRPSVGFWVPFADTKGTKEKNLFSAYPNGICTKYKIIPELNKVRGLLER